MKSEKNSGKPTPSPVFTRLTALFYLFIAVGLSCFSGWAGEGKAYQPNLVVVPEYVGMPIDQAVSRMPNDRLRQGEITEVYADAPPGIVIEQFPEPEMRVDPGTPVNLEVSLGPPPGRRVEVPNVTGLNIRQAEDVLIESGLQTGRVTERVSEERQGIVLEQSPQAGSVVMENDIVNLVISIRDFQVIVPDVRSMQREKAIRILEESRLNYALYYENSSRPENTVTDQDPPPGSRIDEGAFVYLTIATKQVSVPWLFWGGILGAALFGGFLGYRFKKPGTRKSRSATHSLEITFNAKWEPGRQNLILLENQLVNPPIRFKFIQDSGSSTILKPEK